MKRGFQKIIFCLLWFAIPFAVLAQQERDFEPLPEKVFRALEGGKTQTVVVYGTSVSIWGQWAREMEAYFNRVYPGQVSFTNTAKPGMQSNWGVENLKQRVLDQNPDLVFIEFAINDAATKHGISTNDCLRNLDTMIKALQKQNPQVDIVLQTMNPVWDCPTEPHHKKYASDRPTLAAYYDVYRRYAHTHNLPLVDNYPVWKKILDEDPVRYHQMVPDGIHPESEPSKEVAWPAVRFMLDRSRIAASASEIVDVWPKGKMPGEYAIESEALHAPERTDAIRITNVSEPTLTLFPAEGNASPAPAMIVCPGGAYSYLVFDKEGTEIAEWLNSLGISALVLKYRVPDNREGALQDLQRSLRLIRAHAKEWDIDPKKVGVIGFSAGGNLCAKSSNLFDSPAYAAIDGVDKSSCRPDITVLVYPAYLEHDGRIAEELNLGADIPPTLIVHSEDDEMFVPGSKTYTAALEEHNHPCRFLLYATGGHGYGLRCELEARVWPVDAEKWLRQNGFLPAN